MFSVKTPLHEVKAPPREVKGANPPVKSILHEVEAVVRAIEQAFHAVETVSKRLKSALWEVMGCTAVRPYGIKGRRETGPYEFECGR